MMNTDRLIIALVLIGSLIVATAPYNLFHDHALASSICGWLGVAWMAVAIWTELREYTIKVERKDA